MKNCRVTLTLTAVLAILAISSVPVFAGPTYVQMGSGTSISYNGVPFQYKGVSLVVIKDQTQLVSTQKIDLSGYTANRIHIIEASGWSDNVPDNVVVGRINVYYGDGSSESLDLETGVNIAEWAYDRPEVQPYLQHSKIAPAYSYYTNLDSNYTYEAHKFHVSIDTEAKPLDYLELVLDPASYTNQQYYGFAPAEFFAIGIKAITLDVPGPIPAPGAVLLGSIGAGLVGWLRSKRML